jgi:hypothetical protein
VIFLLFLLLATHLLVHLYATSLVSGAAHDAASVVAGYDSHDNRGSAIALAESELRAALGAFGRNLAITWESVGPDVVTIRVTGQSPNLLPAFVGSSVLSIDERASVRVEEFIAPAP